jgi:hypothetical protein
MTPQWNTVKGKKVEASPAIYRAMVNAAWKGLVATGHRHDTVMIGETAAYGAGQRRLRQPHRNRQLTHPGSHPDTGESGLTPSQTPGS